MIIRLRVFGALRDYLNGDRFEIQLPSGSRISELFDLINTKWEKELPPEFWNSQKSRFREQVVVMSEGNDVNDYDALLTDGQEVWLVEAIAGGSH